MTLFLLIRHGSTDAVGRRLVGRLPGIPLNEQGRREAGELSRGLAAVRLDAVYSSPLERARETAAAVSQGRSGTVIVRDALTDVEFGRWTGALLAELEGQPEFVLFNTQRSVTRPPEGEHAAAVQARMVSELEHIRGERPNGIVAVVSHADPLRAMAALFLGMPLDYLLRLELAPASVSALRVEAGYVSLLFWNRPSSASFADLA